MGEANGKSSAFTTKQQAIGYTHRLCVPPVDIYIYIYILSYINPYGNRFILIYFKNCQKCQGSDKGFKQTFCRGSVIEYQSWFII